MKKVGIITSYLDFDKNYGGILQGYALSKIVLGLGFDAYIMPYVYEHVKEKNDVFHLVFRFFRNAYINLKNPECKSQAELYKMIFDFTCSNLPLYQKNRISISELTKVSHDFHAFISGSDQVWSTKLQQNHCDPGMFLKFVPEGVRKIAYAPSMGSTTAMSQETAEEFKNAVTRYDYISAREVQGQQLIKAITGLDAPLVLDPTLLLPLEKWESFMDIPQKLPDEYILVYRFGNMKYTVDSINEIQKNYNLPIIELPSSAVSMSDKLEKRYDINPAQFLGIIKNATLVLTDSFHCTVFSILLKTQFLTFYRQAPESASNMNGRIDDLLELTNLNSRLIKPGQNIINKDITPKEFEDAHKRIEEKRAFSYDYLKTALL